MSWFVAFPITPVGWFDDLAPPPGLKREIAVDLHLTIAFFGGVSEASARKAFELTRAWPPAPAEAVMTALEPLGNPRHPSVIAATTHSADLVALMTHHRDALYDAAEVPRDTRPPLAHVTIARFGRRASKSERAAGLAWAAKTKLEEARVKIAAVALYRSAPSAERKYEHTSD